MTENTINAEATPQVTPQVTLVQYGLYTHDGMVRFATDETTLVDLTGNEGQTYTPTEEQVVIWAAPGSPDWIDRMVRVRSSQASSISTLRQRVQNVVGEVQTLQDHLTGLGEALRDEAIRREWCSEYDEFAREWDLPLRSREYEVTVTLTVNAADKEAALEMVTYNFNLSSYSEDVLSGPEFEASEA